MLSFLFHNPSISNRKHPLGCIWQSIFIILRPNLKTNLTDYHIFSHSLHTSFSHFQEIWLCFSYIKGCPPKGQLSTAPQSFILICQQQRTSSDGPADSEMTCSFKSYRNGATQSKTERPLSLDLAAWLLIHCVGGNCDFVMREKYIFHN